MRVDERFMTGSTEGQSRSYRSETAEVLIR